MRTDENPPLFYDKLHTILKKIPLSWFKNWLLGNMQIGGNEIFCEKEVQMLSAEGNCKQNLWLFLSDHPNLGCRKES